MRIPVATYRLQFCRHLTFARASAIIDYLDDLGFSDIYASPVLTARPGSLHGYDIVDHGRVSAELGGEDELLDMGRRLAERGMGLILDVVPNHMCIAGSDNPWWLDVLENGPSSPLARYFDIDWNPPKPDLIAKVLLPILSDQFGRVLENGEIEVKYDAGAFVIRYGDVFLPVAPRTWTQILDPAVSRLRDQLGDQAPAVQEMESITTALAHLPLRTETDRAKVRERRREKEIVKRRLAALIAGSTAARTVVLDVVRAINGSAGDPRSFDRLERLVEEQGYRLAYWRVATDEINYRRFFDINELAAIRVEEPAVMTATHQALLRLVEQGFVSGFRIDHVDGLLDPEQYLHDLQRQWRLALKRARRSAGATPPSNCYIVVEKILAPEERLPVSWPVQGTTGYEFLNAVGGLFIDRGGARALKDVARRVTDDDEEFADVLYESKKLILRAAMSSELTVLARKLDRISEQHRFSRDFTLNSLQEALAELVACFPVYRTYTRADIGAVRDQDRLVIEAAVRAAKRRNPSTSASVYDFLRSLLLLEDPEGLEEKDVEERRDFVLRFQQLTGPVMAKGLEDTAFYRFFPLASLNEVGGNPASTGVSREEFHHFCIDRRQRSPHGLSATATHDGKRGEDVRARISVLSEIPGEWERAVLKWRETNRRLKTDLGGREAPHPSEEYLFYQTILGAWPDGGPMAEPGFSERIQQYMVKALKEAKQRTSWINPDEEYEDAVKRFVAAAIDPYGNADFIAGVERLHSRIAPAGFWSALSQLLIKIAAPGVPDFYQGTELWDLSLVDPDNRRPVDYDSRRAALRTLMREANADPGRLAGRLMKSASDGRIKLFVTLRALRFRRANRSLFEDGDYVPLEAAGKRAENIVVFARRAPQNVVLVAAGRFFTRLPSQGRSPVGRAWADTTLILPDDMPGTCFSDALAGGIVETAVESGRTILRAAEVFRHMPVALLAVRSPQEGTLAD